MSTARIYSVKKKFGPAHPVLVKAHSQAQALRHVMRNTYSVTAASALDVADYMGNGYKVEDATESTTEDKE